MAVYHSTCLRCGKEFKAYRATGKAPKYCSKECTVAIENHGETKCETCGTIFSWYRSKRNKPRFCSHSCQGAGVKTWRSKHNVSWKGMSDEEKKPLIKVYFFEKVRKTESCWTWEGSKTKKGYGIISFGGNPISAHKLSWEIHNGKRPEELIIRHLCNNPICVNPEHLALGTFKDNSEDMVKSGNQCKGSENKKSILKEEDVVQIKKLIELGLSGACIGRKFNVSRTCICSIKKGKTWTHVT